MVRLATALEDVHLVTYAEFDGDGEEVDTGGLPDGITALNTGQVDEAGLDNALLALGGLQELLSETAYCQLVKTV